ncbi:MAG TPA: amidohydrolase family protein, partial [Spirochaetota bacterium]|nr:amidohydrolase family protein [Spirochaetota bacterium]
MTVYEGTIVTCDSNNAVFRFLVEDNGHIVYTGNTIPEKYSRAVRVNLGKRALLPSFTDTHLHFSSYAVFSSTVDVRRARDNRELADILKQYSRTRRVPFILAFGASSHSVIDKRLVTKDELDRALPQIPVMIIKYDGHASICNSAMLSTLPHTIA